MAIETKVQVSSYIEVIAYAHDIMHLCKVAFDLSVCSDIDYIRAKNFLEGVACAYESELVYNNKVITIETEHDPFWHLDHFESVGCTECRLGCLSDIEKVVSAFSDNVKKIVVDMSALSSGATVKAYDFILGFSLTNYATMVRIGDDIYEISTCKRTMRGDAKKDFIKYIENSKLLNQLYKGGINENFTQIKEVLEENVNLLDRNKVIARDTLEYISVLCDNDYMSEAVSVFQNYRTNMLENNMNDFDVFDKTVKLLRGTYKSEEKVMHAIEVYKKLIDHMAETENECNENRVFLYCFLAHALMKMKNFNEARDVLDKVQGLDKETLKSIVTLLLNEVSAELGKQA